MNTKTVRSLAGLLVYAALSPAAEAHVLSGDSAGFAAGLAHPFSGLDHLLTMVAVGIWAGQRGGKSVWLIPLTFIGTMVCGSVLPRLGMLLPAVEPWVCGSVLVLGLILASSVRLSMAVVLAMVGWFALFHGFAHGLELPKAATPTLYSLGFVLATALLQAVGIGFARSSKDYRPVQRLAGISLIAAGTLLLAP